MRVFFRIEHREPSRVPHSGPVLITPNHSTYFDPFWVGVALRRRVRYMAWGAIFRFSLTDRLFRWFGAFPVSLDNPERSAWRAALEVLEAGEALVMFPEGGRSPDGTLRPFKPGAALLALKTGATVVPVAIHGGDAVWGPRLRWPRPRKVVIEFLEPIRCAKLQGASKPELDAAARVLGDRLRETIRLRLAGAASTPATPAPDAPKARQSGGTQ